MTQSNSSSNDALNDSLDFVKKLWGTMGVPGMTLPAMQNMGLSAPTMSLDELDKRIQELKTVETWLTMNMAMLRNTIQALEIQRATVATLHSLSSTMAQTMQGAHPESEDANAKATKATEQDKYADISPLIAQSAAWWQGIQEQFKQALGTALEKSAANVEMAQSTAKEAMNAASEMVKPKAKNSETATPKTVTKRKSSGKNT